MPYGVVDYESKWWNVLGWWEIEWSRSLVMIVALVNDP